MCLHMRAGCVPGAAASRPMQQSDLGLNLSTRKTGKREFLEQMQQGSSPGRTWSALITPYAPDGRKGRPPFHGLEGGGEGLKDKMPAKRGHLEQPSEL